MAQGTPRLSNPLFGLPCDDFLAQDSFFFSYGDFSRMAGYRIHFSLGTEGRAALHFLSHNSPLSAESVGGAPLSKELRCFAAQALTLSHFKEPPLSFWIPPGTPK